MKDFLDILKKTYIVLGAAVLCLVLIIFPIALAIEFNHWWVALEIVTAPVSGAVLILVGEKL